MGIYKHVNNFDAEAFLIETRAETVTEEKVAETKIYVKNKSINIEIGLESIDEKVRNSIYNKNLCIEDVEKAIAIFKRHDIRSTANVLFGAPFLSKKERKEDTINTARWLLRRGVSPVIFPIHVKEHTAINELYKNNLYEPPTVWEYIDLLNNFTDEELMDIYISSHRKYSIINQFYIKSDFTTCKKCNNYVTEMLDDFRAYSIPGIIRTLADFKCKCKK